jgi:O-antigen ligase
MILGCFMTYCLAAFYIVPNRARIDAVLAFLGLAVAHIWVGVMQFTQQDGYMPFGFIRAEKGIRASGMLICPNHYAGYLEAVAVMGLSLVWWSRLNLWLKILIGYVSAACYFGIAISASRGGYLSSLVSLAAFTVFSLWVVKKVDRQRFIKVSVALVVVLGVGVAGAVYLMAHNTFLKNRMNMVVARDVRFYNWQATLDQFRLAPWFGTGAGTHLIYGRLFRRVQIQSDPVHSHGDYLELLAEYGMVGGALMAFFIWSHVTSGLRAHALIIRKRLLGSYEPRSDSLALNIGALSAMAGLAAHSVVDFNMHIPGNALLFAFIFGVLANPGVETGAPATLFSQWALRLRFLLPVAGIWTIINGLPKLPAEYFVEQSRVALRNKEYVKSISLGNKALGAVDPKAPWPEAGIRIFGGEKRNPDIYFYLGEANRILGLKFQNKVIRRNYLNEALAAYQRGLEIFPEDENMLVRMGQSLDALQRYDEAEAAFQKAMQWDPNLGVIYGYYGAHLKAMGMPEESAAVYKKGQSLTNQSILQIGQAELGL